MRAANAHVLLVTLLLLLSAAALLAQPGSEASPPPTAPAASAASAGPFQPVPVPPASEKAMQYYRSGNVLWVVHTLWGLAVPALLLFTGLSARLRDLAWKLGRKWLFAVMIYAVLFALIGFVLDLPLSYYEDFVREHAYGLSSQTAAKYWSDAMIGTVISCVLLALTLWFPYWLLRKSPRRWWLYTALASLPLLIVLFFVKPIWLDPLFNHFGPMKDKALEASILHEADRAGIEGSRVFEVAKSVDTNTVNAYVTGFLSTKRIVLWDTILAKLDSQEILFVVGHEMGHYVLGHAPKGIAFAALLVLIGLWFVHRSAQGLISRFHERFGFTELSDIASVPLMTILFSLALLVLLPINLAIGRSDEHESDRFGLEITHDNHHCATAFLKLQAENLANPRPGLIYKLWRSGHPPVGERIDFCNEYRPWEKGEPLKYGGLIRQ